MPLAEHAGLLTDRFKYLGNRFFFGIESTPVCGQTDSTGHADPDRVTAGQQSRAGSGAVGSGHVKTDQLRPLGSHFINLRRADIFAAVTAEEIPQQMILLMSPFLLGAIHRSRLR